MSVTATMPRRSPWRTASPYLVSFVVLGVVNSLLGPSVTMLQEQTGSTAGQVGMGFSSMGVGYLLGSVAAGRIYERLAGHAVMAGALVMAGASLAAAAWSTSLAGLIAWLFVLGIAGAAVDVGGNTLVSWAVEEPRTPMLNAMHLCFAVGALVSPLVADRSRAVGGDLQAAAVVCAVGALVAAATLLRSGRGPERPDTGTEVAGAPTEAGRRQLLAMAVFFLLCVGMAVSFVGWVHTFAEKRGMSSGMATALTSAYWVGFLVSRVAAVLYAHRVTSARLLQGTCAGSCVAVALVVVGGTGPLVWVGTAALGAVVAPQFPTALAYLGERFALTGTAVSWCLSGASIGGTTFPYLVGRLLDANGATVMPLAVLLMAVGLFGWFFLLRRSLTRVPFTVPSSDTVRPLSAG